MIRASQAQAAHFILTKTDLSLPAGDLAGVVDRSVALPALAASDPFWALRARLADFAPADLQAALTQSRTLSQRSGMRNEPVIINSQDIPLWLAAMQRQRRQQFNSTFIQWQIELAEVEELGATIMALIDGEPQTEAEITEKLPPDHVRTLSQTSRGGRVSTTSNVALALHWLEANGQLALIPSTTADWRHEEAAYLPLSEWLPDLDLAQLPNEAEAQSELVRRYLAAYGPATEADISFWTGFGKSETARAISRLTSETTLAMVDGIPGAMMLLKAQTEALRATVVPDTSLVNLLGANDPFVRAHKASRARLVANPRLQRQIFNSRDQAKPTILAQGLIAGGWEVAATDAGEAISWQLFEPVEADIVSLIETAFSELVSFLGPNIPHQQIT